MLRGVGMAAAAVAMIGTAVPAEAQWRGHRPYHHHHRGGGIDGGDVLLGALLAGGVIAVASAASKASRDRDVPPPASEPLPQGWEDPDGPDGSFDGDFDGDFEDGDASEADDVPAEAGDGDAAADACAAAAETEGRRLARRATVRDITDVDRAGSGWFVAGTIALSDGYRDGGTERRFRCNVVDGRQPDVRIDGGTFAAR